MRPNVQLEIVELISIDIKAILMLGCTVTATFFHLKLQLRAHAAEAAVKLLSWRDELNSTAHAVAYPCCTCTEKRV